MHVHVLAVPSPVSPCMCTNYVGKGSFRTLSNAPCFPLYDSAAHSFTEIDSAAQTPYILPQMKELIDGN